MTFDADPYRTLGLPRGASTDEVKHAYRRLAKQFHPDSAGERALPRFLAIQSAYEQLVGVTERGRSPRPPMRTGTPRPSTARPRPDGAPWEADPGRTRATRDAYRRSRWGETAEPKGPNESGAPGEAGRSGRPSRSAGGERERPRRRGPRKASLGSTSYDDAAGPFEATWEGGTWYGASSGTYWTINPKEYADPRKHGPEYLARARRARPGSHDRDPGRDVPPAQSADGHADGADGQPPGASPSEAAFGETAAAGDHVGAERPWAYAAPPETPMPARPSAEPAVGGFVTERVLLALVGWPPIGLAIAGLYGELTGCGRFAATCTRPDDGPFGLAMWLVQLVVVAVLLALPRVARAATAGTAALLVAAIPSAVLLSAIGGARDPTNASAALIGLLALAWLVGVGLDLSGRFGPLARTRARVR
jgi:hypothetical protein